MKRKALAVLLVVMIIAGFAACGAKECEHEFTEANYQTPATCTLCGVTEGEVVPAYYPTTGLPVYSLADANAGDTYTFRTSCSLTADETVGTITLKSYEVAKSIGDMEAREGYVFHKINFDTLYNDTNAYNYGINFTFSFEDYYDMQLLSDTFSFEGEDGNYVYMASFNGEEVPVYILDTTALYDDWNGDSVENHANIVYEIPEGYDGAVFTFTNIANVETEKDWIEDFYEEDEVVLFRLDGQVAEATEE